MKSLFSVTGSLLCSAFLLLSGCEFSWVDDSEVKKVTVSEIDRCKYRSGEGECIVEGVLQPGPSEEIYTDCYPEIFHDLVDGSWGVLMKDPGGTFFKKELLG